MPCVLSTIDNQSYPSFIVIQNDLISLPNTGLATAPFYATPYVREPMVATYRVSEDGYAFFHGGYYITISNTGSFVFSDDPASSTIAKLVIPSPPYPLNDSAGTIITQDCTIDVMDVPVSASGATLAGGGMDSYALSTVSGVYQSKYRLLQPLGTVLPQLPNAVMISAPYDSFVRYCPLGGTVVSATAGKIMNGGYIVIQNTGRRSSVVSLTCKILTSGQTGATLYPNTNVAWNYRPSIPLLVSINTLSSTILGADGQLYQVLRGSGFVRTSDGYTLRDDGSNIVIEGLQVQIIPYSLGPQQTIDIPIIVIFGDMVQDTPITNFQQPANANTGPQQYLTRDISSQKLIAWQAAPITILGSDLSFDATYCDQQTVFDLGSSGFSVPKYVPNEYTIARRVTPNCAPWIYGKLSVYGRKTILYNTIQSPKIHVDLPPGTHVDSLNTVDTNGNLDITSFPFTVESAPLFTYYTLQETQGLSGTNGSTPIPLSLSDLNTALTSGNMTGFWITPGPNMVIDGKFDSQNRYQITSISAPAGTTFTITNGLTSFTVTT